MSDWWLTFTIKEVEVATFIVTLKLCMWLLDL